MKPLFWVGLVILILGVASFFVAIPRTENHGISVGDASVGIQTKHDQKIPPLASGIIIVGGIAMMIAGGRGR
jgi:hypothetical protein